MSEGNPDVVAALEVERARWNAAQEEASPKQEEAEDLREPILTEEEEKLLRELGYVR